MFELYFTPTSLLLPLILTFIITLLEKRKKPGHTRLHPELGALKKWQVLILCSPGFSLFLMHFLGPQPHRGHQEAPVAVGFTPQCTCGVFLIFLQSEVHLWLFQAGTTHHLKTRGQKQSAEQVCSPVAVQSVDTKAPVEAGAAGVGGAGLVQALAGGAGAQPVAGGAQGHEGHAPRVHHCGDVTHTQVVGTALAAVGTPALVNIDLGNVQLQS